MKKMILANIILCLIILASSCKDSSVDNSEPTIKTRTNEFYVFTKAVRNGKEGDFNRYSVFGYFPKSDAVRLLVDSAVNVSANIGGRFYVAKNEALYFVDINNTSIKRVSPIAGANKWQIPMIKMSPYGKMLALYMSAYTSQGDEYPSKIELHKNGTFSSIYKYENIYEDALPVFYGLKDGIGFLKFDGDICNLYGINGASVGVSNPTILCKNMYVRSDKGFWYYMAGSPVNDVIIATNNDKQLVKVDAREKTVKMLTDNSDLNILPCFSPDGKKLIYVRRSNNFESIYLSDNTLSDFTPIIENIPASPNFIGKIEWLMDDYVVLLKESEASDGNEMYLLDLKNKSIRLVLSGAYGI
jgi:hypothetical protein